MNSGQLKLVDDRPLSERLRAYGCTDFVRLDDGLTTPEQLDYLDLLPRRSTSPVTAVVEHQGTALLYLVDACGNITTDATTLAQLQRQLANRSDPAWLGVLRPGSLEIHPIGFHESSTTVPVETVVEKDDRAPFFFQSLAHGTFAQNERLKGSDYVFKKIYGLLTQTTDAYVPDNKLEPLEVLSMAGRALFFRFLIDRRIVLRDERKEICPASDGLKDAFANAEKAAMTSAWLDQTFNGDFLQLIDESISADDRTARQDAYLQFYRRIERRAGKKFFDHLHAILNGWHATGGGIQQELDWGDLDFAHIPVGVLSQVYESFSHRADARTAKKTSVHYTPRTIARLIVDQTFAAAKDPANARVLDAACGAGIFLVLAFRRLVRERWQHDEQRPDTKAIQQILYGQLRGFDISESALRLAALALYITAIEVNGTQRPPKVLKFPRNLRNEVLHYFGDVPPAKDTAAKQPAKATFTLGSLGPRVSSEFNKSFDIVLGNPPWTRLREDEPQNTEQRAAGRAAKKEPAKVETDLLNEEFTAIGQRVLRVRGLAELADSYENPDKNPDLPFLWRATEWAKDGGLIAFALPARIFGRTTGKGYKAWRAVLHSISLTGLINGADLRKTAVWEGIDMPFCLLFARNALPQNKHRFYYATPLYEPEQNRDGRFRIDYEATQPVSIERVEKQPWILKTLSLGTWRDVEVMEKLTKAFQRTLADEWRVWNPKADKTHQGYNRSPNLKQKSAMFFKELKDFEPPQEGFNIQYSELKSYFKKYKTNSAHGPRTEALYAAPLVIVPKAPGDVVNRPKAYLSRKPLTFSQSYYGYSCNGHPDAKTLAALIYLIPQSDLFRYFTLMVSVSQGADHMIFTKQDLDTLPFPDVAKLPAQTKNAIRKLARRLERDAKKPWDEIDSLLFRLYGLQDNAIQVVRETLFAAAAYRRQGRAALDRTTRKDRAPFRNTLRELLEPYFDVCGQHVAVEEPKSQPDAWEQPWFFVAISQADEEVPLNSALLRKAMEEANKRAASRIIVKVHGQHGLLLGLLNQRRWWTQTRAELCGQHIVRHHLGAFGLAEQT